MSSIIEDDVDVGGFGGGGDSFGGSGGFGGGGGGSVPKGMIRCERCKRAKKGAQYCLDAGHQRKWGHIFCPPPSHAPQSASIQEPPLLDRFGHPRRVHRSHLTSTPLWFLFFIQPWRCKAKACEKSDANVVRPTGRASSPLHPCHPRPPTPSIIPLSARPARLNSSASAPANKYQHPQSARSRHVALPGCSDCGCGGGVCSRGRSRRSS